MASSLVQFALTPELSEAVRALSSDGLKNSRGEIGGYITLSSASASPDYDVRLVPCDHKSGPLFRLSPAELVHFRESVLKCESEGRVVVAYFRSCTNQSIEVEPADRNSIAFACPGISSIVLGKPSWTGSARICVFHRAADGTWELRQSLGIATPSSPNQPAAAEIPRADPPRDFQPLPANAPVRDLAPHNPVPHITAPVRNPSRVSGKAWVLSISVGVIALAVWGLVWLNGQAMNRRAEPTVVRDLATKTDPVAPPLAAASKLGLNITEENGKLHATWDHSSPAARSALYGSLDIRDSSYSKDIALSPADITGGSILYAPRSGDVTFRLMLAGGRSEISQEMVRFVGDDAGVVARPSRVSSAPPTARAVENAALIAPAPITPGDLPGKSQRDTVPTPAASPARVPASSSSYRPVPSIAQRSVAPIDDPPALETRQSVALPSLPLPPTQVPQPAKAADPVAPPVVRPPLRTAVSTPPVPIHEAQPYKTGHDSWKVYAPLTIGVIVSVDERGRVTKAVPDGTVNGPVNPFLLSLCLSAAKDWTFKPATLNGRVMASSFGIRFRFQPGDSR